MIVLKKALIFIIIFFVVGVGITLYNSDYILDRLDIIAILQNKIYISILIGLFIIYAILITISTLNRIILTHKEEEVRQIKLLDKIKNIDPDLNEFELVNQIFEIYKNIQNSCSNYDLDTIDKYVTNKIYNDYKIELESLKNKNRRFKADDIVLECGKLLDVSKYHNVIKTRIYLSVTSDNKIIDNKTNEVITGGFRIYTSYMFTFIKIVNECPNCGSNTANDIDVCKNCGINIIKSKQNWIMAKKDIVNKGKE